MSFDISQANENHCAKNTMRLTKAREMEQTRKQRNRIERRTQRDTQRQILGFLGLMRIARMRKFPNPIGALSVYMRYTSCIDLQTDCL